MSTSVPSSPAVLCPVEHCLSRHFALLGSLEAPTKLIESIESIESRQIGKSANHFKVSNPALIIFELSGDVKRKSPRTACTALSPSTKVCCSNVLHLVCRTLLCTSVATF